MTRAKSKRAVPDICPEISNKISTREALSVVEATRQNVLEAFSLPSNCDKLPLVATEATSSSLAGFLPVKVPSKRHIWVSPSVASTPTKSPKVFNNRPVNKLVFFFIDSTSDAFSTTSSKKIVKKTRSSEKWEQLLASAIVTLNPFVVSNEILDEISIALSGTLSKIGQDQPLAVLPNVVFFGRSLLVLEAKQSSSVGSSVLGNWADQMETDSSSPLVSGAIFDGAWETINSRQRFAGWVASTLVSGATFRIKLAHVKAVFQSVHGFLGTKSVLKDNVKLFCVEFASQQSLEAAFLVELTSSVHLTTLKIAKSLVVSESGSSPAAVVLRDMPLGVSAADIKLALSVFGSVACVVLKPAGIWQYMMVYFEKLDSAVSALKHCQDWYSKEMPYLVFKSHFVGSALYVKTAAPSGLSEFPLLVALLAASVVDSAVGSRLDSLEKQILDLAALVKSIVELVGSLVVLVSRLLDNNAAKAVQVEKNLISMKSAANNFSNLLVGVSKDIACLRSEVDFNNMDYDDMLAAKPSFLSEDTIERVIALWRMSGTKTRGNIESTRLFLSEFIFDFRNLNSIIERIRGLRLFPPIFDSV
ncbi:hypothetical protein G9A89_023785 [Geosiphon pyriformis]|nr:hypothetical protein G9A89_023785 [Geosiphon pyriformis]